MKGEVTIKAEGLWHVYPPNVVALRDINLEIKKGELIAIIGQNGGGKTTLAKHFNGLLKPTKGMVLVGGIDTKDKPPNELALVVGYVFQNPMHQIFSKTVYEEVAFGPRNAGLPEEEVDKRVEEALKEVSLSEYKDTHPLDLDYGKIKLLTIASIMSMKPEVYCLDEPTTGQDHVGRRVLANLVKKINKEEGATVIVITHDMKFVAEVADRIILMVDGKITADGPTRETFQQLKLLQGAFIKPPQIAQLAHELSPWGVPRDLIKVREMAEFLGNKFYK